MLTSRPSKSSAIVVFMFVMVCWSLGVEPRDYGTYDELGLIPFENVKATSAGMAQGLAELKRKRYSNASKLFESELLKNKFDDQAIVGLTFCARQTKTEGVLLKKASQLFREGRNGDLYALNMVRALLRWKLEVEEKGDDLVSGYLLNASQANSDGFLVRFRTAMLPNAPRVTRQQLSALCRAFPKVEGLNFYRIRSYFMGYLGEGYVDANGKLVRKDDPENFPKVKDAQNLLSEYLAKPNIPVWASYLNAFALIQLKQPQKAEPFKLRVEAAAAKGVPLYQAWSTKLASLTK